MAKKPQLSSLSARLARKDAPEAAPAAVEQPDVTTEAPKGYTLAGVPRKRMPKGQGEAVDPRKAMLVRADPKTWKKLKLLALEDDRPLQDLLHDAVMDYLKKRGQGA